MKKTILSTLIAFGLLVCGHRGFSQPLKADQNDPAAKPDTAASADKSGAKAQLTDLVKKIQAKLDGGKSSEQDLAPYLKEFDGIVAQHKDEKTDDVAEVLFAKALLYLQVLENEDKATEILTQLKTNYPDTKPAKNVDLVLKSIEQQAQAKKIQKSMVPGAAFPDFAEKDLNGNALSVGKYKGKVLLVDFWATWCGPCVAELPNVLKAYQKYHEKGFEIVGISLDKDKDTLDSFLKKKEMTWSQFFDGKGWQNELAEKYGIMSIPATYLLDKEGKIAAKDLRGDALETELAKLLEK